MAKKSSNRFRAFVVCRVDILPHWTYFTFGKF
jgi:hypothetical protein